MRYPLKNETGSLENPGTTGNSISQIYKEIN